MRQPLLPCPSIPSEVQEWMIAKTRAWQTLDSWWIFSESFFRTVIRSANVSKPRLSSIFTSMTFKYYEYLFEFNTYNILIHSEELFCSLIIKTHRILSVAIDLYKTLVTTSFISRTILNRFTHHIPWVFLPDGWILITRCALNSIQRHLSTSLISIVDQWNRSFGKLWRNRR